MEYKKNKKFPLAFKKIVGEAVVANKQKTWSQKACQFINAIKCKWTKPSSQIGYKALTAQELFSDRKEKNCDSTNFKYWVQFARRCEELLVTGKFEIEGNAVGSFVLLEQESQGNAPVWGKNFLTFSLIYNPHSRQNCQRRFSRQRWNLCTVIIVSGNVKVLNLKSWDLVNDGWKTGAKSAKFQF